ncbi:flagellar motor switch protein FliM (plasmid) [Pontibacillus sp. ALD_SL1]|uniref:flagellar motor switch protein FliM n=1 Tax=Pontibacillus sp. ALD_SL1 TaxID=2777185 RepID=UPI001A96F443|nr:flagellar motor switch protein FliM [Pontibacillus sp. ALD_SL1]QST03044.1 flagellar motor switch protein FliM [Pontibacillus sp. ALD_SL1]
MADELSQKQIDAIFKGGEEKLSEMAQKDSGLGSYEQYDFNRPDMFNRDHLNSLRSISSNFARGLSQFLSASLRTNVEFKLKSKGAVEQVPFASEYVKELVENYFAFCITELGVEGLGAVILEFDLDLVLAIQTNYLGGGDSLKFEDKRRALSPPEMRIMEGWVKKIVLEQLTEAFKQVITFQFQIEKIETDPQHLLRVTRDSDMLAILSFDLEHERDGERVVKESVIRLCIPHQSIEPIIHEFTTDNIREFTVDNQDSNDRLYIEDHIKMVKRELEIELGKSAMTVRDLMKIEVDDYIELSQKINKPLVATIDNKPKFSCRPGKSGIWKGVRIVEFAKKGDVEVE